MVRTYKKKSSRGSWSVEIMKQAIDAVLSKTASYRKASQLYDIPHTTLMRHVAKIRRGELCLKSTLGNRPVLSEHEEEKLVRRIKEIQKSWFGVNSVVIRKLAYHFAERYAKTHSFNRDKRMAGVDWLKGFMKRHPDLSIGKPEATTAAQAMDFKEVPVDKLHSLLGELAEFQADEEEEFGAAARLASTSTSPVQNIKPSIRVAASAPPPLPPSAHPLMWPEEPVPRIRPGVNTDECQIFGDFVASELRTLRSDESRKKLKRIIQKAILRVGEDEDVNIING